MLMQIVGANKLSNDAILRNVGLVGLIAGVVMLGAAGATHLAELGRLQV